MKQAEADGMKCPLPFLKGRLLPEWNGERWPPDTGAPSSLGNAPQITLDGADFAPAKVYPALAMADLARFLGVDCGGLPDRSAGCFPRRGKLFI